MSSYFKEYVLRMFKRHMRDFAISIVLFIITIYFVFIRSGYAEVIGPGALFIYIIIRTDRERVISQAQQNYRSIESLLLPLSEKELFFSEAIRLFFNAFPVCLILVGLITSILLDDFKMPFGIMLAYSTLGMLLLLTFVTNGSLRINFKKVKKIHGLTKMTRGVYLLGAGAVIVLVGTFLDEFVISKLLTLIFYAISFLIYVNYLIYDIENNFLHEHNIYNKKEFKWFDIPGLVIILFFVFGFFYNLAQPARQPASVLKERIHKQ